MESPSPTRESVGAWDVVGPAGGKTKEGLAEIVGGGDPAARGDIDGRLDADGADELVPVPEQAMVTASIAGSKAASLRDVTIVCPHLDV
jgi:hypothetical protein